MVDDTAAKLARPVGGRFAGRIRSKLPLMTQQPFTVLQRFAHFWVMVGTSFIRNRCPVRASALAYTTLLALVPLLAVGISVSTAFLQNDNGNNTKVMIDKIVENMAPQLNLEVKEGDAVQAAKRAEVVEKIYGFIQNIQTGKLGATGMISLVAVAIMLLANIEATFNDIWGVSHGRNWFARVTNYWAAVTLGPILFIVAVGLTTGPYLKASEDFVREMPYIGNLIFGFVPFIVPCVGFGVFYQVMPNTHVHWRAAAIGGMVGGILWQLNNIFNVIYVSKVVTYSKIYGSLGILPVFLGGVYFSWLILLFGAQVAYAVQNREAFRQQELSESVNHRGRELIALQSIVLIGRRFNAGGAITTSEIANELTVPSRLVEQVLVPLQSCSLVQAAGQDLAGYTPGRPLEMITIHDVLDAMRTAQGQDLSYRDDETTQLVGKEFERIESLEGGAAGAVTLRELVDRVEAGLPTKAVTKPV